VNKIESKIRTCVEMQSNVDMVHIE
jgi:hypothetical protein